MNFKALTLLYILVYTTLTFSQTETTINVTHFPGNTLVNGESKFVAPDFIKVATTNLNCFSFLDVDVYVKASTSKEKPYVFKLIVTNNSSQPVQVSTSNWGFGSAGAHTIPPKSKYEGHGVNKSVKHPAFKIYNISFRFDNAHQQKYGIPTYSSHLECNETLNSYLAKVAAKNKKKQEIQDLKDKIRSLGNTEADLTEKLALYKDLQNLNKKGDYSYYIGDIEKKLKAINDAKEQKRQNISELKDKIKKLGNSKEELKEKKQLYNKLGTVDEENSYEDEINSIDQEIKKIETQEKEETEQEEEEKEIAEQQAAEKTEEEETEEEEKQATIDTVAEQQAIADAKKETEKKEAEKRINAYEERIASQRKQNEAIAASNAAASATILYLIGGVIYNNMGRPAKKLYSGYNIHVNFDIGYGFSWFPIAYNSIITSVNYNGDVVTTESNDPSTAITIDLRLALKLGYETEYGGGNIYGQFEPGFGPVFSDFNTSYGYGLEFFGGHKIFKLYGRYGIGSNNFSTNNWLNPEEIGEGGKSSTDYKQIRAGLKFSFYSNPRTARRDHLIIGIMENYFDENSALVYGRREIPGESSLDIIERAPTYIAKGYFFEWKKDHTHRLYIEIFDNYPITGEIGGASNEGNFFIQAGFVRSIEGFFKTK